MYSAFNEHTNVSIINSIIDMMAQIMFSKLKLPLLMLLCVQELDLMSKGTQNKNV